MPQYDAHHWIVRRALVKDGWTVTHDQLMLKHKGLRVFVDLAEKELAEAQQRIAVEVKVFGARSEIVDFEKAAGQYSLYREMLVSMKSGRELFLAVAQSTYEDFFQIPMIREYVSNHQIHLLIFNEASEEIVEWIRQKN